MKKKAKKCDVIVIGSGAGDTIADNALNHGMRVAWVDRGPLGGTCMNVGCIPTKILVVPADRIVEMQEASKLGIDVEIKNIDFGAIMERMRRMVGHDQSQMREGLDSIHELDIYEIEAYFVDERTLQVGDRRITGDKIFIAAGARPSVPPIQGLDEVEVLTNESVLQLTTRPESMVMIGGGYISTEFAHFFAAMGTRVTIVQRNDRLVREEEPEISALLKRRLALRMAVHTGTETIAVRKEGEGIVVTGRDVHTGEEKEFLGQKVLLAIGRTSNADVLRVENAGIAVDERGYIRANDYLETNVDNIWAFGDIIGKYMFRHSANREAVYAWHNSQHDHKIAMNYSAIPHAVFSYPQIASVGLTEEQAKREFDFLVGTAKYTDVAKGQAMMETSGFAKAIIERDSRKILGYHIIGPYAPMLIQEVIDAMANDQGTRWVAEGMHIHPALPEVVVRSLYNLREPD